MSKSDMKNKGYFPDNVLLSGQELNPMFINDQLAMMVVAPSSNDLVEKYGMDKNKIAYASMPGGPAGRYTQLGGAVYAFSSEATPEQIDACMNWIKYIGDGPELTDDSKETIEDLYAGLAEKDFIVGVAPYSIMNDDSEVHKFTLETVEKYANVDTSYFADYMDYDKVEVKPEEPVNCQELYQVLSGCVQEALSGKSGNELKKLLKDAADNFEKNSLKDAE